MVGRRLVATVVSAVLVAACAGSPGSPEIAYRTPDPAGSWVTPPPATLAPSGDGSTAAAPETPPVPTPTPTPEPGLSFGRLTFTSKTCYRTDLAQPDGRRAKGIVVTLSFKVRNAGDAASGPLWLIVETKEQSALAVAPARLFGKNPVGPEYYYTLGDVAYFPGAAVKAGRSLTWKLKVYFRESKRVVYAVSIAEGPAIRKSMTTDQLISGDIVQTWEDAVTKAERC